MQQADQILALPRTPPAMGLRVLIGLFKLRIGLAIALAALAGLAVASGGSFPAWRALVLALAVTTASAAAGAFNQYAERDLDAKMRRTRDRAFVTGRLAPGRSWLAVIAVTGAAGVALAAVALNPVAAMYTFLGAFTYAIVYTVWLKRRTWWNIVIGGLAGSFAVMAGAATASPRVMGSLPLSFALVLFLWTPPHFWSLAIAYHDDYAAAQVPMLPVVVGDARAARAVFAGAALLVAASMLPALLGMGWLYSACALGAGAYLLITSARLVREPTRARAMRNFAASIAYLAFLLAAAIVDALVRV